MRVLHAAAEVFPLIKTGGLADVAGALPPALRRAGADARLLLPGFPSVLQGLEQQQLVREIGPVMGAGRVSLLRGRLPFGDVPTYVIDAPYLYARAGNPYLGPDGREWSDNLQRFALMGWVGAHIAAGELDPLWTPDVLHAHDWHAAMACAYVAAHPATRAATVFTVHNLAYQGLFDEGDFGLLELPVRMMYSHGLEFHSQLCFMKAGLVYAQHVTTVSPTYAREITTEEFGCGLEGVLRARRDHLSGILNGVDGEVWNPATDTALAAHYDAADLSGKAQCKQMLQQIMGLQVDPRAPLLAIVSRLTAQKGLDLVLGALPILLEQGAQLVVQGTGDAHLEAALAAVAAQHPRRVAVRLAYDENFAHCMVAGSDMMLVPSRFEPCGLTQLYALRYGSVPVVRHVGGLVDTVTDAGDDHVIPTGATGFQFGPAAPAALGKAITRAVRRYHEPAQWQALMRQGMARDFSWENAAEKYLALYRRLVNGG